MCRKDKVKYNPGFGWAQSKQYVAMFSQRRVQRHLNFVGLIYHTVQDNEVWISMEITLESFCPVQSKQLSFSTGCQDSQMVKVLNTQQWPFLHVIRIFRSLSRHFLSASVLLAIKSKQTTPHKNILQFSNSVWTVCFILPPL